ncbi:hypothetical protein D6C77_10764 [Aureobasidium pullulans]|nr:hypothetical protein D6C77_10764 [Aureobasidium pullulans]
MEQAIDAFFAISVPEDRPSIRQHAKEFLINRTTFARRVNGGRTQANSHEHQQRLTDTQEDWLVQWIKEMDERGYPPSHTRAREMATQICVANGDTRPLGIKWLNQFIVIGRVIEAARIDGTRPEVLQAHFDLFHRTKIAYEVTQANCWNMDEHGIAMGKCVNSLVLSTSNKKRTYVESPESREWVSILGCINANGNSTTPLIIFKGQNLQTTWFNKLTPHWQYTTSENGWTSNNTCLQWLVHMFVPQTQPIHNGYRILLCDGHGSHVTTEFMYQCKINKVELIYLPAHSSHVLQPLDVGAFSPLKGKYRQFIQILAHLDDATPNKKKKFLEVYTKARQEVWKPETLKKGWETAGLFPWNPDKSIKSSQVNNHPIRAVTPPNQVEIPAIYTPASHQALYRIMAPKIRDLPLSNVDKRMIFQGFNKAGKAINSGNI